VRSTPRNACRSIRGRPMRRWIGKQTSTPVITAAGVPPRSTDGGHPAATASGVDSLRSRWTQAATPLCRWAGRTSGTPVRQVSSARAHRGANAHPGISSRIGRSPAGWAAVRRDVIAGSGVTCNRPRGRVCRMAQISPTVPFSSAGRRRAPRCDRDLTWHPQVMRDQEEAAVTRCAGHDQIKYLRLHRHVRRGSRLVGDDECRWTPTIGSDSLWPRRKAREETPRVPSSVQGLRPHEQADSIACDPTR
jgi:hypothetical protein